MLLTVLEAMKWEGYGYAVVGWVSDTAPFYAKTIGMYFIPDASPENSAYSNMICF